MLGSITPLGQRARGFRFWPTGLAYITASAVAGASFGALLGALGTPLVGEVAVVPRLVALGVLAIVGLAMDLRWGGLRLPTIHRQVNEEWMARYRGPIFGAGFGLQLGLGVVTIVTTSAIYLTFAGAALSGDAAAGALIGLTFGLVRALPLLTVARVRDPDALRTVQTALDRWRVPVRRATYTVQSGFVVLAGLATLAVVR